MKWIKTLERLPEKDAWVLVYLPYDFWGRHMAICSFDGVRFSAHDNTWSSTDISEIPYWRHLPELPELQKDD